MIQIIGVTASGKSRLAFELAQSIDAEIISVDSMKVYRRMDIGTAKPSVQNREKITYHLIDIIEPSESFSVGAFIEYADKAIENIKSKGKTVIAVGGTALYIKALLYGLFEGPGTDENIRRELMRRQENEGLSGLYKELKNIDPVAAERINQNDSKRIIRALEVHNLTGKPISSFQKQWETHEIKKSPQPSKYNWTIIGLRREKRESSSRINKRVKKMIESGLVEEVKSLLDEEKPLSKQARCAIGYAEIIDYLNGHSNLEDAVENIKKNTRRFAKSQRTWFKTFRQVHWLDVEPDESPEEIFVRAKKLLSKINPQAV